MACCSERDRRERDITSIVAEAALGDTVESAEILRKGVQAYPDATRILLDLGLVETRLGHFDAAIRSLEARRDRTIAGDFLVHRALEDAYRDAGLESEAQAARLAFLETVGQALEAAAE